MMGIIDFILGLFFGNKSKEVKELDSKIKEKESQ